jgi:hypothetical protein
MTSSRLHLGWSLALASALAVSACGEKPTPPITSGTPGGPPPTQPVLAACAGVVNDTPFAKVPAPCQAIWGPKHVTVVPGKDALRQRGIPAPPIPQNDTKGAVSDADAAKWAGGVERQAAWYAWGEAKAQPGFVKAIQPPTTLLPAELALISSGGTIDEPACNLYPDRLRLSTVGDDGARFFVGERHPTRAKYVFIARFEGPCAVTGTDTSGKKVPIFSRPQGVTVFLAGAAEDDPALGTLWLFDAASSCDAPGRPDRWCQP